MRVDFATTVFEQYGDDDEACIGNRVLVIDDDAVVRDIIRRHLERAGFDVVTAAHGGDGLRLLHADRSIGLVLLDLMMPHMDGWRFRHVQHQDARLTNIPTVIMTGGALPDSAHGELKAAAYIHKPIAHDQLVELVRTYCGARQV